MKLATPLSIVAVIVAATAYISTSHQRKVDFFQEADRLIYLAAVVQIQTTYNDFTQAIQIENIPELTIRSYRVASGGSSLGWNEASRNGLIFYELSRPISSKEYSKITSHLNAPVVADGHNLTGATGYWKSSLSVKPWDTKTDYMKSVIQVEYVFSCSEQ
jgi:hypothetical protein